MQQIEFLLPNRNIFTYQIQNQDQVYYRNISKDLQLDCSEEFVALYDLTKKNIVSKLYHKLCPEKQYKIFYMNLAINIINGYEQNIQKLNDEITKLKVENKDSVRRKNKKNQEINQSYQATTIYWDDLSNQELFSHVLVITIIGEKKAFYYLPIYFVNIMLNLFGLKIGPKVFQEFFMEQLQDYLAYFMVF
ncbi:unnamed protein product [Paramecium sonneborni]|uniref:Uncharacterized protein n=1 Tax=Paramecium sonneborni TaxID=65129 RepID=A0A8S1RRY9_9CILI|nr:unnamed protein product [Paramecium sonneborni]